MRLWLNLVVTVFLWRPLQELPVVVVGGGLAGLAASIEASRRGAKVTLMEKDNRIGGNSAKATSGQRLGYDPFRTRPDFFMLNSI